MTDESRAALIALAAHQSRSFSSERWFSKGSTPEERAFVALFLSTKPACAEYKKELIEIAVELAGPADIGQLTARLGLDPDEFAAALGMYLNYSKDLEMCCWGAGVGPDPRKRRP